MVRESTSPTSPAPTSGNAFRLAVLGLIGLGAGSSAFFFGFYRATVWEPMLLAGLVILLAFVVARPAIPQGASALGAAGLVARRRQTA